MKRLADIDRLEWLSMFTGSTNNYFYVLLDPLKSLFPAHTLHLTELKRRFAQQIEVVLRPDLAYSPEYCPHLLVLAKPGEQPNLSLVSATLEYAQKELFCSKRYIAGWMTTALPPSQFAHYLVSNMQRFIQQSGAQIMPYFEPFRLALLFNTLEEEEVDSLFTQIESWSFLNLRNQVSLYKSLNVITKDEAISGSVAEPIRFNAFTEKAQQHKLAILQLYEMWQELIPEQLPTDALNRVMSVWLDVMKLPLHYQSDRFFLALNRLTITDKFCLLPEITVLIEQASQSDTFNLTRAIQRLSPSVWNTPEQSLTSQG